MSASLFNANFYRAANSDLASFNNTQLQLHFQNYGLNEGRRFSPLVDLNLYRSSNSELTNFSYRQAYEHLQSFGIQEGRKFSAFFDFNFYRATNNDLASLNNEQLFEHLQNYGMREGRKFSAFFDFNFYRATNNDLASLNNEQLFEHLQNYGMREGRQFSSFVNLNFYRSINSDLSGLSNNQALQHLIIFGLEEGRRFSPFVDLNIYRAANPDLFATGANNSQLLEHLETYGVAEGRRFSVSFDSNYYRNTYSDLRTAGLSYNQLFEHFQTYGLNEGRASSVSFNVSYYLANNSDLKALNFNNHQALQHFEIFGFLEKRQASVPNSISPLSNRYDNTLGSAFNFDIVNSSRNVTNQFIGTTDRDDYYRFTLAQFSNVSISLTGLSDFVSLSLIYDNNGNGIYDSSDYERLTYDYGSTYDKASIGTTLEAATYFIRVSTDYSDDNSNYGLGVTVTTASRTTPKDPGNSFATAVDVGTLNLNRSFTDFVGSADRDDYYRFNLAQNSNVNLSLSGLSDLAYIALIYDSNGDGVYDSNEQIEYDLGSMYDNAQVSSTLAAGNYFLRIYTDYSNNNTNYTLGLSATVAPRTTPKDPGSTFDTAVDVGTLYSNRSYTDFVGSGDRNDYYRFTLAQNSKVSLSLSGLNDSAYMELIYDSNGNGVYDSSEQLEFGSGYSYGNTPINATLAAGTYFVRVNTDSFIYNTNYTLSLTQSAYNANPVDPGNSMSTALNLGTLSGTRIYKDVLGVSDREDWFSFNLSGYSNSNFNLSLTNLSDSVCVELIYDTTNNGIYDPAERLRSDCGDSYDSASIKVALGAGTYFIRAYTTDYWNNNTGYTLTLSA
ncbi:PPC domain-containing protein [Scytonema sp. NUACC26]|uniref:PPC domain-containing protein n=1 Tax=Scytonema sp. NUACC26 TaxID=3140176 RepID=UPI0034DBF5B4